MITYVNTVLVSNLASGAVLTAEPTKVTSLNTVSSQAGSFVVFACDEKDFDGNDITNPYNTDWTKVKTIKVGIVTKKNSVLRKQDGTVEYRPIVKWSNFINADSIKSYNKLTAPTTGDQFNCEDAVCIDFSKLSDATLALFAKGGKRIIVRLTFKDLPTRYRKWTESYEYVTQVGDTKETIVANIVNIINKEWKRARVQAFVGLTSGNVQNANGTPVLGFGVAHANSTNGTAVILQALPYDDDDAVDTLNWAAKVRFDANLYYTDPAAEGWEANNKNFPTGVIIIKRPGKQYAADAKLVRDREAQAMGYQGILNRGEGTWPIIKPEMETDLTQKYNAITLEFENTYRAADDIFRKTKQTVEIYAVETSEIAAVLDQFVSGQAPASESAGE